MWYLLRDSRLQFGMHYISITFCKHLSAGWCVLALLGHVFSPELSQAMTLGLCNIKAWPNSNMTLTRSSSHLFFSRVCLMLFGIECTNTSNILKAILKNISSLISVNISFLPRESSQITYFMFWVLGSEFKNNNTQQQNKNKTKLTN